MALGAILAELSAMHVLPGMAAETALGQARITDILLRVAGIASGFGMLASQREAGLFAVIEAHSCPAVGAVTGFT